ncbi:MAG: hypothetical protein V3S24_21585 [Candidatus Tectomicrobia bacterium]
MKSQSQADLASAWIEAHYDEFHGQWVSVRLDEPALVAYTPTLSQLWQVASPALLKDCFVHYVHTLAEEN